ncbi:uncharacterized protein LOC133184802 isoform X2 [Saccostrea echinata]|uniref:uncharacterized protein LOC133184802 isoform X2 n=1 Tax=Saccostrea echinata TaxID=191078 RepID=UPI002A804A59|nr:uncharacterized protein LOC133184802 isoform X2 [Saccostrea echinata]
MTAYLCENEAARYTVRNICPLTALRYATEGKACNKPLEELKEVVNTFNLTDKKGGCNSSCLAYFNYDERDGRLYDIFQAQITVFNKIRNVTWLYDVDCKKVNNHSRRILSIKCKEVENNAFYYQRWCRNTSDCLQDQECNMFGDLGVCSRACKNDTVIGNQFHQSDFEVSTVFPVKIQSSGLQIGYIVAAAIGGLVLGLTVCAVVVICIMKNRKHIKEKSENLDLHLANNSSCKTDMEVNISKNAIEPAENKKSPVGPFSESNEEYSTFQNTKREREDIYNHLNEKTEERDLDDYDHTHVPA